MLQVRRYQEHGRAIADAVYDEQQPIRDGCTIVDLLDPTRRKSIPDGTAASDLLVPVFRGGKRVYDVPSIDQARRRVQEQLALFHAGVKRFVNPHPYPVGLERGLHEHKSELILKARGFKDESS